MTTKVHHLAIAGALLLSVACASTVKAPAATQETVAIPQLRQDQGDGKAVIETEQEAADVALWFLRGRRLLGEQVQVETRVFERDRSWHVLVVTPRFEAFDARASVEIARSGHSIRMTPGL